MNGHHRRAFVLAALLLSCAEAAADREALLIDVLAGADEALIRARPKLAAGKYRRMSDDLVSYYRGTLPVWVADWTRAESPASWSRFALDAPLPVSPGDLHPENVGILIARDGTAALEVNDLDAVERYPYLWDLRRLATGLVLGARLANADDPVAAEATTRAAGSVAGAAVRGYAEAIRTFADGAPLPRIDSGGEQPILVDLFARSARDLADRAELTARTVATGGRRHLARGAVDPADPSNVQLDLPAFALDDLPRLFQELRSTLVEPPAPDYFTVLDAVRELGTGVASWPRVRALVLLRGPGDDDGDDVIVELKELSDAAALGWLPPGSMADDVASRVADARGRIWARPDAEPLWGTATWLGLPVQVRTESEAQKTLRLSRWRGTRGTVPALLGAAEALGKLLARVHAAPLPEGGSAAGAIAARIESDPDGFVQEQVEVAVQLAAGVEADQALFRQALARLGPRLGLPVEPGEAPSADVALWLGDPPDPAAAP